MISFLSLPKGIHRPSVNCTLRTVNSPNDPHGSNGPLSLLHPTPHQNIISFLSPVMSVVGAVGGELCKCLIGMHAFTGCDAVSAFAGKLVKQQTSYQEMFKQLGMEWVLSDMLFQSLQEFTCKLYCSQPGTDNINELRYRLFCAKKGNIDSTQLPRCVDCLFKHASRANFQAAIWKRSLQKLPRDTDPHWFWLAPRR